MGDTATKESVTPATFGSGEVANKGLATFGAGCYWGTEKYFRKDFASAHPGALLSTAVGFMGDDNTAMKNPSYRQVCSGDSGHVEVLHIEYDAGKVAYEALVRFFYTFHDPTTPNRQGNDSGPQYASAIFVHTEEQKAAAEAVTGSLQALLSQGSLTKGGQPTTFATGTVSTAIRPAGKFYPAEQGHQDYLNKNPGGYCNHRVRFKWPEAAL